ncbi:outer membrane protein assembly factor BamD [Granulosicoccus sp. 3-233]|uniref:outer membrane protein assembly factor BamD n=1 Tax=Granulosicoccus sp. 3-233 TaxID=3417969 RepID=UPI003D3377EF
MILKFSRFAALAVLGLCLSGSILSGCASQSAPLAQAGSAEELYRMAKRSLNQGDFLTAIGTFEVLGARYPFGSYTQQAQLDIAYAYLKQDEFDNAINAADRFIKLYPRNENIDYAYYIKGVSHFSRGGSTMERIFPRDMSKVNQQWLRAAFADFDTLVRRFPESRYAEDSLARMAYLKDEMARHELNTAQFYYQRGAMVAVVNRISYLLEHYDGSRHIPNSLALMAAAYEAMGQTDLQQDTLRVLAATAPEHPALDKG